jgi:T6SS immunity protein Tdi1, C-terminal
MSLNDYIIDHRGLNWPSLFSEWTWLIPNKFTVWIMNRFGDLFVVFDDGSVHMLDIGRGTSERVADSRDDFGAKIDEDNNANDWLMISLVDKLVAAGITLREGQCYSYKQPPVLGGDYTIENTCVLPIAQHYGTYGSIHNQIKDFPDGSQVVIKLTK